jgi:hypothetical protein
MTDLLKAPAPASPPSAEAGVNRHYGASAGGTSPAGSIASVGDIVRRLLVRGLAPAEAGNLAALMVGLRPATTSWTVAQIEHLRFLRAIVRDGLLQP